MKRSVTTVTWRGVMPMGVTARLAGFLRSPRSSVTTIESFSPPCTRSCTARSSLSSRSSSLPVPLNATSTSGGSCSWFVMIMSAPSTAICSGTGYSMTVGSSEVTSYQSRSASTRATAL